jgi:protein ImuB
MYACLSLPVPAAAPPEVSGAVEAVAREFSPRMEVHKPGLVTLDIAGLGRLLGVPEEIGRELQESCARRSVPASVAIAATRSAAMLLAVGKPGLTVVPAGEERRRLAPMPLACLGRVVPPLDAGHLFGVLDRWGLKTLGDLARLPAAALSARIGQDGLAWQRLARGEDLQPLIAQPPAQPIEEQVDLDWPVEGLEPLSFVLARLFERLADRLERLDQAATVLHATFRLSSRASETRTLQLPAPMRDPKVLRTLILLHLESHPLGAGVDRVAMRVETARARVTQFSLLGRALPFPEQVAPLLARLAALVGEGRVGAPGVVDSYRPGAFVMAPFEPSARSAPASRAVARGRWQAGEGGPIVAVEHAAERPPAYGAVSPGADAAASCQLPAASCVPRVALRRFRLPVAARVTVKDGRPVRVTTERRGLEGGMVESAAGPWRTSGEWWRVPDARVQVTPEVARLRAAEEAPALRRGDVEPVAPAGDRHWLDVGWNRDEWDVALSDGGVYRIYRDRSRGRWFVDGIVD